MVTDCLRMARKPTRRIGQSAQLKAELQEKLIARTQDQQADLRARIAAGEALGLLGDPRFELRVQGYRGAGRILHCGDTNQPVSRHCRTVAADPVTATGTGWEGL